MELDDLKTGWQLAGDINKTQAELQAMTKMKNHPVLKEIRHKLVIEALLMTFLLFIYYDAFDGGRRPWLVNLLLVSSMLLIILNDVISYIFLSGKAGGDNLKTCLQLYRVKLKRMLVLSISLSILYSISLLVFFGATISFTTVKYLIGAALFMIMLVPVYVNYRIWLDWIKSLTMLSGDMEKNV